MTMTTKDGKEKAFDTFYDITTTLNGNDTLTVHTTIHLLHHPHTIIPIRLIRQLGRRPNRLTTLPHILPNPITPRIVCCIGRRHVLWSSDAFIISRLIWSGSSYRQNCLLRRSKD